MRMVCSVLLLVGVACKGTPLGGQPGPGDCGECCDPADNDQQAVTVFLTREGEGAVPDGLVEWWPDGGEGYTPCTDRGETRWDCGRNDVFGGRVRASAPGFVPAEVSVDLYGNECFLEPEYVDVALVALPGCEAPQSVLIGGEPSGWETCADGVDRRVEVLELVGGTGLPGQGCELGGACAVDGDCTNGPLGRCEEISGAALVCGCSYSCTMDADCGAGQVCVPGPLGTEYGRNQCIPARCTMSSECGDGDCAFWSYTEWWLCDDCFPFRAGVDCLTSESDCRVDGDCDGGDGAAGYGYGYCAGSATGFECVVPFG